RSRAPYRRGGAWTCWFPPRSCVAGIVGQVGEVDPDATGGGLPARVQRQVEQQLGIGRRGQPVVLGQLLFQLAGSPARATQCDDRVRRPFTAHHRLEDLPRGGQEQRVGDGQGGIPLHAAVVQHEPALGV